MTPRRALPIFSALAIAIASLVFHGVPIAVGAEPSPPTARPELVELDAFWREMARSVKDGDFEGYKATCHPTGVLVNGISKKSHPLSEALARWKPGFDDIKAGKMKATVEFRFSQRLGDKTTAHETGIFRYSTATPDGKRTDEYIHFEALLQKTDRWLTIMEHQKSRATPAEWDALAPR